MGIAEGNLVEVDSLYSPSFWSKRFSSPEETMQNHVKYVTDGKTLKTFILKI